MFIPSPTLYLIPSHLLVGEGEGFGFLSVRALCYFPFLMWPLFRKLWYVLPVLRSFSVLAVLHVVVASVCMREEVITVTYFHFSIYLEGSDPTTSRTFSKYFSQTHGIG